MYHISGDCDVLCGLKVTTCSTEVVELVVFFLVAVMLRVPLVSIVASYKPLCLTIGYVFIRSSTCVAMTNNNNNKQQ